MTATTPRPGHASEDDPRVTLDRELGVLAPERTDDVAAQRLDRAVEGDGGQLAAAVELGVDAGDRHQPRLGPLDRRRRLG